MAVQGAATVVVGVDGSGRTHRLRAIADAAAIGAVWIAPTVTAAELSEQLERARADGSMVVVDDAHRLTADVLRTLAKAARDHVPMVIARRPTLDRAELADLDEAVAALGGVEHVAPLAPEAIAAVASGSPGDPPSPDRLAAIVSESGGLPALVLAVASVPAGAVPPALLARVQRRLATAGREAARIAQVLALQLDLPDSVLSTAGGVTIDRLPSIMRELRDAGLLATEADVMIPAVAGSIRADLSPSERRRVHHEVARALLTSGVDPLVAAEQLRAARVVDSTSAEAYRIAGERLRFTDPDEALGWFEEAADAGAEPARLAAGRAEAAAILGQHVELAEADSDDQVRMALVAGAVEAHRGRSERAADMLLTAGALGRVLAVPALVATARLAEARQIVAVAEAPASLLRLAEAAVAMVDPPVAAPLFIEAAEAMEQARPAVVLPDTPHALGALVAVAAGETSTAERLLQAGAGSRTGGVVAADRHRLLLAWVRMRSGRFDTALAELGGAPAGWDAPSATGGIQLPGRDQLLRASLAAGVARRSGDVAKLRESWAEAEHMLARRTVDIVQIECVEELVVAAARLGQTHRAMPVVSALQSLVDRLDRPTSWSAGVAWIRLQVGVALDHAATAAAAAERLWEHGGLGRRVDAQRMAARCWARVLGGDVDAASVVAAADDLAAAELPWEASRLAGQGAIRTPDPVVARRLLERAREFGQLPAEATPGERSDLLSEREIQVGRLVLAGRTHREIGAQLYVSPKTVEHHVARMRTKLGVSSRAEFLAALREIAGPESS